MRSSAQKDYMQNKMQCEQAKVNRCEMNNALDSVISEQVIQALGAPCDLRNVQIRRLWADHYRVNVLVGSNASNVKVANSFFVTIDEDGKVVTSAPKITKQYS